MNQSLLEKYTLPLKKNNYRENVKDYFRYFNREDVYCHTMDVQEELKLLKNYTSVNYEQCELAIYMHDLGRVVATEDLVSLCEERNYNFILGERKYPPILHQIASKILSRNVFGIKDPQVLNAIECHTTLKSNPTEVEKIVFIADKLSWKEESHLELVNSLKTKVEVSIEHAIFHYLKNLHYNKEELICYHVDSYEAYRYFYKRIK